MAGMSWGNAELTGGHLGKEPFESAGCQDHQMARRHLADDAKGVFRAARDDHGLTRPPDKAIPCKPGLRIPAEHDKGPVGVVVDVARRAGPRRDRRLGNLLGE